MKDPQIDELREKKNEESIELLRKLYDWYEKLPEDNLVTWWRVTPTELAIFITHQLELAKIEAVVKSKESVIKDCKLHYSTFGNSEHYINCNALTKKLNDEISELTKQKDLLTKESK